MFISNRDAIVNALAKEIHSVPSTTELKSVPMNVSMATSVNLAPEDVMATSVTTNQNTASHGAGVVDHSDISLSIVDSVHSEVSIVTQTT